MASFVPSHQRFEPHIDYIVRVAVMNRIDRNGVWFDWEPVAKAAKTAKPKTMQALADVVEQAIYEAEERAVLARPSPYTHWGAVLHG